MKRVVVGLSGGVDSSVAAYLLKRQGYDVVGLFMKNWHDDSVVASKECPWIEDSHDAMLVAKSLDIPFQTIDLSEEYKNRIVEYMFQEYEQGRTPNPDVLCNREIKFDVFLNVALSLGADYVATGHYCGKDVLQTASGIQYRLLAGADKAKDQSYFLCQSSQYQLSKALFPLGGLEKSQVRAMALENKLVTAEKKDSQGLCFVGKIKLPDFLKQRLSPKDGAIVEIPKDFSRAEPLGASWAEKLSAQSRPYRFSPSDGVEIGRHNGAHFFTIGQRKGLNVGGKQEPLFVVGIDTASNTVYVGEGHSHAALFRKSIFIPNEKTHWIRPDLQLKEGETLDAQTRIRYRQPLQKSRLYQTPSGLFIDFEQPQSAVTEGQFAAWYMGNELVGSGVI